MRRACLIEVALLRALAVRPEPRIIGRHKASVEVAVPAGLLLAKHLQQQQHVQSACDSTEEQHSARHPCRPATNPLCISHPALNHGTFPDQICPMRGTCMCKVRSHIAWPVLSASRAFSILGIDMRGVCDAMHMWASSSGSCPAHLHRVLGPSGRCGAG